MKKANTAIVEFDPIILLTAVWKGIPPSYMIDFLEEIDLHGKRIILGLVGDNETDPKAVDKLRCKVEERGSRFITTIYLREVITGPNWIDLGDEDFTKDAAKLAELVFTVSEVQ